jgi:hypothetical protein
VTTPRFLRLPRIWLCNLLRFIAKIFEAAAEKAACCRDCGRNPYSSPPCAGRKDT